MAEVRKETIFQLMGKKTFCEKKLFGLLDKKVAGMERVWGKAGRSD